MAQQQLIYVEGVGFIPIETGQTPKDAITAAQSRRQTPETPPQKQPAAPQARSMFRSVVDTGEGMARGAVKGVGESVFNLGALMKDIPADILIPGLSALGIKNIGDIANAIGPEGTNANQAFAQVPPELEARGGAEKVGKTIEQVGEFFLPSGKVGPNAATAAQFVGNLPRHANTARRMATDAWWKVAPMVDDALGAGAVSMAHGDEQPEYAMGANAAANLAGQAGAQASKLLQSNPLRQIVSILAGALAAQGAQAVTGDLLGAGTAGLGTYAVGRNLASRAAQNPGRLMWAAENAGRRAGAVGAGAVDQTRRRRREQ